MRLLSKAATHIGAQPFKRTMSGARIYEGLLAVHKPEGVTSAGVLRHLQAHFNPSKTFEPWIEAELERRKTDSNYQRNKHRRRFNKRPEVKIGHGGTLDPMATGVLVTGIGRGTKYLQSFLDSTKTYETVVTFGVSSDTYDNTGKTVRRTAYEHVTREMVEEALAQFRGKILQRPPIFSAKRVEGKRLYEYAREGKEPPIDIKSVPVEVFDLQLLEWYEPGKHEYKWPQEELTGPEKEVAEKMLDKDLAIPVASAAEAELVESQAAAAAAAAATTSPPSKRKASPGLEKSEVADEQGNISATKRVKTDGEEVQPTTTTNTTTTTETAAEGKGEGKETGETEPKASSKQQETPPLSGSAAARIRMTVSSGFYVRSLAHDLGKAVGSFGIMCSLVRIRQGDYTLEPDRVLEYTDLEQGEEVWGPKVQRLLAEWQEKNRDD